MPITYMTTVTTMTMIIATMLEYDFMRNAFAAAGVAAVVSGLVGYFLVLRGQTLPVTRSVISALPERLARS